jgi:hypothetical protein
VVGTTCKTIAITMIDTTRTVVMKISRIVACIAKPITEVEATLTLGMQFFHAMAASPDQPMRLCRGATSVRPH